jgi:predicted alpha/beta-fold hydrolase
MTAAGVSAWAALPDERTIRAPWWLPGGQAQTIWPALAARHRLGAPPQWRRERWITPDGDFVDADWLVATPAGSPRGLVVLFHGLEGSSASHYATAFADWAARHQYAMVVPHFRGCSGELNLAPRAYHSGDFVEIGWMLDQVRQRHDGPAVAVGVSLGGNALLRWAQEAGRTASDSVQALASICAPLDLAASGQAIGRGLNRCIYTPMFLRSMKPKALAKLAQHPGLFDVSRLQAARNLYEFDQVFTAPLHGFRSTDDYWRRASAQPRLADIRLPALVLNPLNDPFVPASSLPRATEVGHHVQLWQPGTGGHVGFASGAWPGSVTSLPEAVMAWMKEHTHHG